MSDEPICDFCSHPQYAKRYHCADFPMDQSPGFPELRSKGDWLACSKCAVLIDSENWNGLLQHALNAFQKKYPMLPRVILSDRIKTMQDLFRQYYVKAK